MAMDDMAGDHDEEHSSNPVPEAASSWLICSSLMMIEHHEGATDAARVDQAKDETADAKALAQKIESDQTAEIDTIDDVVLFGTSAALAVVNGYAPASGSDRGSVATRVFGARVYMHEQATAGNVYAFAPGVFQVFSSRLRSASVIDPTNGMNKFGQWLHSHPGRGGRGWCRRRRGRRDPVMAARKAVPRPEAAGQPVPRPTDDSQSGSLLLTFC
jgi:Domain of unknown function (DUF305)